MLHSPWSMVHGPRSMAHHGLRRGQGFPSDSSEDNQAYPPPPRNTLANLVHGHQSQPCSDFPSCHLQAYKGPLGRIHPSRLYFRFCFGARRAPVFDQGSSLMDNHYGLPATDLDCSLLTSFSDHGRFHTPSYSYLQGYSASGISIGHPLPD